MDGNVDEWILDEKGTFSVLYSVAETLLSTMLIGVTFFSIGIKQVHNMDNFAHGVGRHVSWRVWRGGV